MDPDQDNKAPQQDAPEMPGDQTPANGPMPMVGGSGNKKKMWWLWLLILLIILALLFFGWWWWKDKDKKDETAQNNSSNSSQQEQQAQTATCDAGFTSYETTDLGLGFCYPTAWGTPSVVDAKFAAADTGQRWKVTFASKPVVNLGVVTDDWSTTVPRDGVCVDPAVQVLPAFSPFSTSWETEGTPVTSGTRGIEVMAGQYLIQERVDDVLTNGVCLEGYTITGGDPYSHTAASYSAEFAAPVTTPQQHIDDPNILISEANRNQFYTFVKSVHKL